MNCSNKRCELLACHPYIFKPCNRERESERERERERKRERERVALEQRIYNKLHDKVLQALASTAAEKLPSTTSFTTDLGDTYQFPLHITPTTLRPDMVWWDDSQKQLVIIELTVCFETLLEAAAEKKETKYHDLVTSAERAGYNTALITLEMGSRGVQHPPGFTQLAHELFKSRKELSKLLHQTSQAAITGSYQIWCTRNRTDP